MELEKISVPRNLPAPPEWAQNVGATSRYFLLSSAAAAALITLGIIGIRNDRGALTVLAGGLLLATGAYVMWIWSRVDLDRTVTTLLIGDRPIKTAIPVRRSYRNGQVAAHIAGLFFCTAVLYAEFADTNADGSAGRRYGFYAAILAPVFFVWLTARLISRFIVNRDDVRGLSLSTEGIHRISWWGDSRFRWSNIAAIEISPGYRLTRWRKRRKRTNTYIMNIRLTARGQSLTRGNVLSAPVRHWGPVMRALTRINVAELAAHPPVVAHLVKFYFEHPELREELGTEKALERVRTGNFIA